MAPTASAPFPDKTGPDTGLEDSGLWLGWTMALSATLGFSIAPAITRGAILLGLNPNSLLVARMLISTFLLGGMIALTSPARLKIDRLGLLVTSTAGLANGVGMVTFFWSLARVDASVASMIFSLNPLVVLGMLALRGEKLTHRHTLRLLLGLSGVCLLIGPGGRVDWLGATLVVVAVLSFAVQLVLIQWFLKSYDARTVTLYVVTAMTAVCVGWWLIDGPAWRNPGWQGWLAIGVLAVVSTFLARLALFLGVRQLGGGQMALLIPLETLLAVVWSMLFLDERFSTWQWGGSGLILVSALLAVRRLGLTHRRLRWRLRPLP
jgi:drug/metabolite transporter (DMT)-like permease